MDRKKNYVEVHNNRSCLDGAAGLCFEFNQKNILIDPHYTRIGKLKTRLRPNRPDEKRLDRQLGNLKNLLAVIVGHTHSDHSLDIPYLSNKYEGLLLGSTSLDTLMRFNKFPCQTTVCHGGETFAIYQEISVTMIPSAHSPV